MKYRKKPVVIDAVQFKGIGWYETNNEAYPEGLCRCDCQEAMKTDTPHAHIHTLEGVHLCSVDDWIITGIHGERYPCKPDIFEKTYEKVEETKK